MQPSPLRCDDSDELVFSVLERPNDGNLHRHSTGSLSPAALTTATSRARRNRKLAAYVLILLFRQRDCQTGANHHCRVGIGRDNIPIVASKPGIC